MRQKTNLYVRLRRIHDSRSWCKWKRHPFPCKPTYLWFKGLPKEWTQKLMWVLGHFLCWRNLIGFVYVDIFFFCGWTSRNGPGSPHCRGFTIALRHTTFVRTPLNEWSAHRTWQHTAQQTDIRALARFEPTVPVSERPQSHAIDRTDTGMLPGHIAVYPLLPHTCWDRNLVPSCCAACHARATS